MFKFKKPEIVHIELIDESLRGGDRTVMRLFLNGRGLLFLDVSQAQKWRSKLFYVSSNCSKLDYVVPTSIQIKIMFFNILGKSSITINVAKGALASPLTPAAPKITKYASPPTVSKPIIFNGIKPLLPQRIQAIRNLHLPKVTIHGIEHGKWKFHELRSRIIKETKFRLPKFRRKPS